MICNPNSITSTIVGKCAITAPGGSYALAGVSTGTKTYALGYLNIENGMFSVDITIDKLTSISYIEEPSINIQFADSNTISNISNTVAYTYSNGDLYDTLTVVSATTVNNITSGTISFIADSFTLTSNNNFIISISGNVITITGKYTVTYVMPDFTSSTLNGLTYWPIINGNKTTYYADTLTYDDISCILETYVQCTFSCISISGMS